MRYILLLTIMISTWCLADSKEKLHFCKQGTVDNCRQWKASDISGAVSVGHSPEEPGGGAAREGAAPAPIIYEEKSTKESPDCKPENIQAGTCILTPKNPNEKTIKENPN